MTSSPRSPIPAHPFPRTLRTLWASWALLLAGSFVGLPGDILAGALPGTLAGTLAGALSPIRLRVASSAVLVLAAWVGWLGSRAASRRVRAGSRAGSSAGSSAGSRAGPSPAERHLPSLLFVAIGMTLGALGDASALVPEGALGVHPLLPAMGLFGLGHGAYVAGLLRARPAAWGRGSPDLGLGARASEPGPTASRLGSSSSRLGSSRWAAVAALWLAVVLAGWHLTASAGGTPPLLRGAALVYALLLGSTASAATGLAVADRRFWIVALGAALFVASDTLLAVQSFRGGFPWDTALCWATYGPGQMLIVFGTLRACGSRSESGTMEMESARGVA